MTQGCGAIILAAGHSRRMGSNKLLALHQGKPLVAHVADAVAAAGLPAIVVLGHDAAAIRDALKNRLLDFVVAKDHVEGMGRSIAAGIRAAPSDWEAAFICLGDMPLITPQLLRKMRAKAREAIILAPVFEGRRGNPVLWGRNYFDALKALQGDEGARSIFPRLKPYLQLMPWPDNSIIRDFDTPEDLKFLNTSNNNSINLVND